MQNLIKILLIAFLVFFGKIAFAGGAWVKPKGDGYFKLGQSVIQADKYYNKEGEITDIITTSYYSTYLYGEYGLGKKLELFGYMPFLVRVVKNRLEDAATGEELIPGDALTSFGDTELGLKYGIVQDKMVVWSTSVILKLPLGNDAGGNTGLLQSGDGAFSQTLRTDVSSSFGSFYASGYAALRHRGNNYSDEWRLGGELGWSPNQRLYAIFKINSVNSFFNKEGDLSDEVTGVFSNNTEYLSPGLQLAYEFKNHWGVSLSAQGAFYARNILAAPTYGLGVFYNLKR